MNYRIYLFEDGGVDNFLPLVWVRPFLDLRLGIVTLFEKWENRMGRIEGLIVREYLKDYTKSLYPDCNVNFVNNGTYFFLNARLDPYSLPKDVFDLRPGEGFKTQDGDVVIFALEIKEKITDPLLESLLKSVSAWRNVENLFFFRDLSELVKLNESHLKADFERFYSYYNVKIPPDLRASGEMLYIHEEAEIDPFVVIDSSKGPVIIEKNAKIMSFVFIEGPAFIGMNSLVKPFTKIFGSTTIGPVCKVAGEIEATIFHSYSNKQHDGFIGHSYVLPWVNLGADTVTSDLKNNYSTVKLKYCSKEWDTKSQFLGTFFCDHVKTGINTMLTSGTIIGVFSNVFGGGYMPKFVPSFYWGGQEPFKVYELDKALETARKMMARRGVEMSSAYQELVKKVFDLTERERACFE
jgi:UDP-N-acetylglucosamine diphosphorylase/glucosamine-1-phosphate N-acetyltransferase